MSASRRSILQGLAATAAAASVGVAGYGCTGRTRAGVFEWRYASPYSPGHPYSRADAIWLADVQQRSAGRLPLRAFWGGALIGESDSVRELGAGVADASYILPIYSRAGAHLTRGQAAFYQGTHTMQQQEQVFRDLWQQFPALSAELPRVEMLLATGGPPLQVMTGARRVVSIADLRGLRLRTPAELAPVFDRLGVDAEFMAMGEVYSAISRGTIDGLAAPLDVLRSLRLAEVVKYVALLQIPRGAYPSRAINRQRLAALPPELQRCIEESRAVWQGAMHAEVGKATQAGLAFAAERGVIISELSAEERLRFGAVYAEEALRRAQDLDRRGFPGSAMLAAAQHSIGQHGYRAV